MTSVPIERYDVSVEDRPYLSHGGEPLMARLYRPARPAPMPLVVEVHGGAWCRGSRLDEDLMNRALAQRGIAVVALDFRMPPVAAYPASISDINYGVRWAKSLASELGTRPDLVSLMGVSSGGHQAMLAAMRPHDSRYAALPLPDGEQDATVARVVMCWPVIDPLGRYQYALEWQTSGRPYPEAIPRVIPDHLRYWGDTAAMAEGSPLRLLEAGTPVHMPAVLCVQGEQDQVHPRSHIERYADAWRRSGGSFSMRWFAEEAEGFINKKPDSPSTLEALNEIAQFLHGNLRVPDVATH